MTWCEFAQVAPGLAAAAETLFEKCSVIFDLSFVNGHQRPYLAGDESCPTIVGDMSLSSS